ncbi:G8 domain-containing protein [Deinococcus sp.]|uniref:G8 domain-containing protein n=1 Tax=Deinococcus sp. TaxID=47478 RepID=UPI003CC5D560
MRPRTAVLRRWLTLGGLTALLTVPILTHSLSAAPRPWSDPQTWQGWGAHLPQLGEAVVIPAGQRVLLDITPPPLASLEVDGELSVADQPLRLEVGSMRVAGTVEFGTAQRPLTQPTELVLGGDTGAGGEMDGTLMVLAGGTLELRSQERLPWTHLDASAEAGSSALHLAQRSDWHSGDELVLAPSGFDPAEAEQVQVQSVSEDGRLLTLAAPLRFRHFGEVVNGIDERAEVGLLSHNLRLRGDDSSAALGKAGGVMVMQGGTLHASDTEFTALGRRGELGHYPIHFHLSGDAQGSFVQRSSIHHTFNRCVTLHGTQHVRLAQNVTYDDVGHCFFLEDGNERQNLLEGNLALLARPAAPAEAILETDTTPSLYWISNPDNVLHGNVAAGAAHSGFWYNLTEHGSGPGASPALWPRRTPLGGFYGNVSHSNTYNGLFVDNLKNPPGVLAPPNYEPTARAVFRDLTAYKNRRRGVWLRGRDMDVIGARLADNAIGATFAAADTTLQRSVVVGESANASGPPKPDEPQTPLRGFEFYDGPVSVQDVHFENFESNALRQAGALGALRFSPFFTHPQSSARGLSFVKAQPVLLEARSLPRPEDQGADGYRNTVFLDQDGSVTGTANTSVTLATPWFDGPGCTNQPAWGALVCPDLFGSVFIADMDREPRALGPLTLTRADGASLVLRGNPREGPNTTFQANLRAGGPYRVTAAGPWPQHLRVSLHHLAAGQEVRLDLPGLGAGVQLTAGRDHPAALALSGDQAEFETAPGDAAWSDGQTLHLKLVSAAQGHSSFSLLDLRAAPPQQNAATP